MMWVLYLCGAMALLVAPSVAVAEALRLRREPDDVGFWVFARQVEGRCHVRWGRRQSPIVRLPLPNAEGRARAVSLGRGVHAVEVRTWLPSSVGFAGRVCLPPAPPARWQAPGMRVVEAETPLDPTASMESTDPDRLNRLVSRRPAAEALSQLAGKAAVVEWKINGRLLALRTRPADPMSAAAVVEALGGATVDALRVLLVEAAELATALAESGEAPPPRACAGCGRPQGEDPWQCPGCGEGLHRGCREMTEGCAQASCRLTADAPPELGA